MAELFDASQEAETVSINERYKEAYIKSKKREELSHLREKIELSTDDESHNSNEEDSDAELLTRDVDYRILKTIAQIKHKEPAIYDESYEVFGNEEIKVDKSSNKSKPLTYSAFLSKILLKEGAEALNEDAGGSVAMPAFEKEQADLKKAFVNAATADDREEFLFESTGDNNQQDEEEFKNFLINRAQADDGMHLFQRYLQDDDQLDESEKFLRDYVLYEGWRNRRQNTKFDLIDTVVDREDEAMLAATEQFEAGYNFRFEEGPEAFQVQGHARKVLDSVRKKDERRKLKRQQRSARKNETKGEREREIQRLKQLKQEEILERLRIIQEVAGGAIKLDPETLKLDTEFDGDAHEKQMATLFGQEYEEGVEENPEALFCQDKLPDQILIAQPEIPLSKRQRKKLEQIAKRTKQILDEEEAYAPFYVEKKHGETLNEEADINSDQKEIINKEEQVDNIDPARDDGHLWYMCDGCYRGIHEGAKRYDCQTCENFTLCTKCFRAIRHPHQLYRKRVPPGCKPPYDDLESSNTEEKLASVKHGPEKDSFIEKALEEYYALDYEDIIGGMPVRFKYRQSPAADCGLTTDEILNIDDKDLNQIVPFKHLATYETRTVKLRKKAKEFLRRYRMKSSAKTNSQIGLKGQTSKWPKKKEI